MIGHADGCCSFERLSITITSAERTFDVRDSDVSPLYES